VHKVFAHKSQYLRARSKELLNHQTIPHRTLRLLPILLYIRCCLDQLQRVQNTLARVVTKSNRRASAWSLLQKLHWLPVRQRIKYKLAVNTFKAFRNHTPDYLSGLLHEYMPGRSLRSSNSSLLVAPFSSTVESRRAY